MKRQVVFMSAFAMVMAVSFAVYGQPPQGRQGGPGGRGGGFMMGGQMSSLAALARSEAVQKELGVTDEQKSKLAEVAQATRGQGGGQRNFQDMTAEERQKLGEEMAQRRAEQDKKVAGILDAKQLARLEQIQVQASGASIVMNEDVAAKLKVTQEQQTKLREALRELRGPGQGPGQGAGPGAFAEMREKSMATLMEILTADQKAAYKELAGEPFDLSQLRGPARGGNRPQRGN